MTKEFVVFYYSVCNNRIIKAYHNTDIFLIPFGKKIYCIWYSFKLHTIAKIMASVFKMFNFGDQGLVPNIPYNNKIIHVLEAYLYFYIKMNITLKRKLFYLTSFPMKVLFKRKWKLSLICHMQQIVKIKWELLVKLSLIPNIMRTLRNKTSRKISISNCTIFIFHFKGFTPT